MTGMPYHGYHGAWQHNMIERMQKNQRISSGAAGLSRGLLRDRLDQLESELRFVTLLSRALMEVLLKHGTTSKDELSDLMRSLDTEDGLEDEGLAPAGLALSMGFKKPAISNAEKLRRAAEAMNKSSRANRKRR